ncbi:interleukin-31-like [Acomys russatus]|uniref:interleukin-31-like n=1 Tax=Acomys russatus TaxID=60746 RepID=UPI0021E3221A|nr:interleukin-31-like [Acomys russatus]
MKPAVMALCFIGTCLVFCGSSFGAPTSEDIKTILDHLKLESKELYEDYSKKAPGILANESLQLPCFTLGREASANISVIRAHLEKVKVLTENRIDTTTVIKRLDDINCFIPLKLNISGPKDTKFFEYKTFSLTVLKRFSDCMAKLEAKNSVC